MNAASQVARTLSGWTVYDHPADDPDHFVARRWDAVGGHVHMTSEMFSANTLAELRGLLPPNLMPFARSPNDDPVILETWL